jgi:hypothetical protein
MPAKSQAQQRFMAMCLHGGGSDCPNMAKSDMRDFASTKRKGLPNRLGKSLKRKSK